MTKKTISTLSLQVLDILVQKDIIDQKKIELQAKPAKKTIKYYNIKNLNYKKLISDYISFSYSSFYLIEIAEENFITTGHYSKTYEIYRKNFNSNKRFNLKNVSYIMNKINVRLYVDKDYQLSLNKHMHVNSVRLTQKITDNICTINELYKNSN
jgi:hypothetical protein